ncbi:MAG: ROK family protein [Candidatus Nanopelagicaceae bacterium]|nr:ROK family protein [Candidatus Nanopelagicaceae bacterium]
MSTKIASSSLTIGIDIGGTKVLGGVVDGSGKIIESARRVTPAAGGKELIATIVELIKELNVKHEIAGIGICVAALISADQGTIVGAPNIANLSELNFVAEIKKVFDLPVIAENDANAAMWAEYKFGNAKGFNPVMFFIIGTGMGGGLVIDGKLFRGANGIGAEFGHMIVQPKGILCGCGAHGCIEQYASGSALMRYAKDAITADPVAGKALLETAGEINNLTGEILTQAAKNGDQLAISAFNKQADWLGSACASYTLLLDPQAIVVGGGVVQAGELFLAPVRAAMEKYMPFAGTHLLPKVIAAKFGNDAGVIGAADLVRG